MVQVLARPVALQKAPPTLEEFEDYIVKLGWSHLYEHGKIEIAQSAQRITRTPSLRTVHHDIQAHELEGLPVAYVGLNNCVYVIHIDRETKEESIRKTIIPAYFATKLRYGNAFFSFGLQHIGTALYSSNIAVNRLVLKAH